jgi:hypothetical protein
MLGQRQLAFAREQQTVVLNQIFYSCFRGRFILKLRDQRIRREWFAAAVSASMILSCM